MLTRSDVDAARARIRSHVRRTPLLQVSDRLWLKCEFLQTTGSFKVRGAFNRILAAAEEGRLRPEVGIVAASGGNAGLANAYAASTLGVPATIFVPVTAPAVKVDRLRNYGAEVVQVGNEYAEAYIAALQRVEDTGALFCHAYDQKEIAAGAGTLVDEILESEPSVDTVVVAVGGGGLLAGVVAALDGRARAVAVEPVTIPTLNAALRAGAPVDVAVSGVAADSLGARRVGDICWSTVARTDVWSILVDDKQIIAARAELWNEFRIAAEFGAATALAALGTVVRDRPGNRVAVVVCGANTDPSDLAGDAARTA